jgi:hypothetical protein
MDADLPVSPITLCNLITQDASLNLPSRQVRKVADGAFSAWFGKLPPSRVVLDHTDEDDVTRVSAVVSHLLRREEETDGEIGIASNQFEIMTNVSCDFGTDGVGTCASDPIRIESAPGCTGNEPPEQCLNSDSRWKTIVTHEIGHVLQRNLTGRWRGIYEFANAADDHPGAPFLCQCQHISAINTLHCLQSLEKPGAAQVEGYAHYVVGRTWNALEQNDCVFPYYKHFLSPACVVNPADCTPDPVSGLIVNSPPVATSCIDPIKWRNNQCLSGTFQPGEVPTDLSVEMDWMGFYYKLTNPRDSG